MKKKWTALLLAGTVLLNLTACKGGGSGSDGEKESVQKTEDTAKEETSQGVKDAWEDVSAARAVVQGDVASYGPITMKLPKEYAPKDKKTSYNSFFATDALQSDYTPHIDFSSSLIASFSTDMREELEKQMEKTLSEQGAQFREIIAYEESRLEEYGVIRATVGFTYEGFNLVDEIYQLYETTNEYGKCVSVEYYGEEDDKPRLTAAKEAMDSIALITEDYEKASLVTPVSAWETAFNSPTGHVEIEGVSVKFGPLHIDLPEGYTVEDESAETLMFYGPDGVNNYTFTFNEDSYYLMSNRDYVNSLFTEEYTKLGYENINLAVLESMEINGYKAVEIGFDFTYQGTELSQAMCLIFEDVDAVTTQGIAVTYTGTGRQSGEGEAIAAVFESIRID